MRLSEKKMVLFGAGKIGRSFIGQLFSRSGYRIVFIDVCQPVIEALNKYGRYKIIIKDRQEEEIIIKNVQGINASEKDRIAAEIASAGICAVSVGQQGLPSVISLLAAGLNLRFTLSPDLPLDIIIAENMRNADSWFRENLCKHLPGGYPFEDLVGLVETSIGKMVPVMTAEDSEHDPLLVFAEAYNTLILDKLAFKNPVPDVEGLAPKNNIKAWVDRKLFIHNLGHAVAAYNSFDANPDLVYLYEGLAIPAVYENTKLAMEQSAEILMAFYPGEFAQGDMNDHIADLLQRFQNHALGDTIHRVGCDLPRKLSPDDRLVTPMKYALQYKLPYSCIKRALYLAFDFKTTDQMGNMHPEDVRFHKLLAEKGREWILRNICGLEENMICNG